MKNFISPLLVILIILTSCLKEPTACIEAPITTVEVFEDVTFSSCSQNEECVKWTVEEEDGYYNYGASESIETFWFLPGTYYVELKARSKRDKYIDEVREKIQVVDVCYTCARQPAHSINYCYSDALDKDDFDSMFFYFESSGYECTKQ